MHHPEPAQSIGQSAGERRAERRAEQRDRDHGAGLRRRDPEMHPDAGYRTIYDRTVVAEQEAAESGRRGEENYPAEHRRPGRGGAISSVAG
jgi:hypothetical protein